MGNQIFIRYLLRNKTIKLLNQWKNVVGNTIGTVGTCFIGIMIRFKIDIGRYI